MTVPYLATLLMLGTASPGQTTPAVCASEVNATATAYRLSELPPAIRRDLALMLKLEMADSGSVILQTDAPTEAEARLPQVRFLQAMFVRHTWYVSFEISMTRPYTVGYNRAGGGSSDTGLERDRSVSFIGPPCEAIKAGIRGLRTFDPSIFDN